jgi:sugar phosphate isomerase/epimerase
MMRNIPVALQMYTIRDEAGKDYETALAKVAGMGYEGLEIGGFGPYSSDEWKEILKRYNLKIIANHIPIETLEESFNHIAEFNLAIGNRQIVCPYLREERRENEDDYKRTSETLNNIGVKCKEKGLQLHYHNHAFEFQMFGAKNGLDILFENTDPDLVKFEIDTYWVKYAGKEPLELMLKYRSRCTLLHLKDMEISAKRSFAEVGEGCLDFEAIMRTAIALGVELLIVEQDICKRPSLESVRISLENIKRIKQEIGIA